MGVRVSDLLYISTLRPDGVGILLFWSISSAFYQATDVIPRLCSVDVVLWNQTKYILVSDIGFTVRSLWRETPEGWSCTVGERCDFQTQIRFNGCLWSHCCDAALCQMDTYRGSLTSISDTSFWLQFSTADQVYPVQLALLPCHSGFSQAQKVFPPPCRALSILKWPNLPNLTSLHLSWSRREFVFVW